MAVTAACKAVTAAALPPVDADATADTPHAWGQLSPATAVHPRSRQRHGASKDAAARSLRRSPHDAEAQLRISSVACCGVRSAAHPHATATARLVCTMELHSERGLVARPAYCPPPLVCGMCGLGWALSGASGGCAMVIGGTGTQRPTAPRESATGHACSVGHIADARSVAHGIRWSSSTGGPRIYMCAASAHAPRQSAQRRGSSIERTEKRLRAGLIGRTLTGRTTTRTGEFPIVSIVFCCVCLSMLRKQKDDDLMMIWVPPAARIQAVPA